MIDVICEEKTIMETKIENTYITKSSFYEYILLIKNLNKLGFIY